MNKNRKISNLINILQYDEATGAISASAFVKTNGTSSQFLKADGSVDTSAYLTTATASSTFQTIITNPVTGTGASGRVAYWNGTSTQTGSANLYWDAANNRLGIGLTNPQRGLEIYSSTADSHLRISGPAPSVSLGEAITGATYQAKFGLATGSGQFAPGTVAGDFVIISQTGSIFFNTNSNTVALKLTSTGAAVFANSATAGSFVKSGGTSSQFLKADGSVDTNSYLTGITSAQVTTALGYTPYNSTNPDGYITSSGTAAAISKTIAANGDTNLVYAAIADNDFFRIRVGGASNAGWVELATADDGTEPIYVRQYTGVFTSVTRTATLLDGSGNTSFPGSVTGSTIYGSDVYTTGGWFRNHTNNNGIYWSGTSFHIYPESSSDIYVRSGASDCSIHMTRNGTSGNYIHNASDNAIGFLSTSRSWIFRVDNSGNATSYSSFTANGGITVNANSHLYLNYNYGCTVVGTYASTRYQGVFSMGTSWMLPIDGTSPGNLYGLAWSHPNAGGQAGYLSTHGLLVMENGSTNTALANGIWTRGDVTAYSDARVKTNIKVITDAVEKVKAIRGVTFNRTDRADQTTRFAGVIAQEVLPVLPEVVTEDALGTYSVAYGNLSALLIEAIKEQQIQIDELKQIINEFTR